MTQVVPGQSSDDPRFVPAIQQAQAGLNARGLTHSGDSQRGALDTRACIQHSGDYSLTPLARVHVSAADRDARLTPVWRGPQRLTPIYSPRDVGGQRAKLAVGIGVIRP